MTGKKDLLVLRLEGALQSWGDDSKWDFRDSGSMPTKSGIVGLLGCALGLPRGDPELTELSNAITMAVRADRPGVRAIDYQTVTGNPLMNAEGKKKTPSNTIISKRVYLEDACFTVFLDVDEPWRSKVLTALHEPRWCLYLGRKCCVPSRPVFECTTSDFIDFEDAVRRFPPAKRAKSSMEYETEIVSATLASYTRPDRLLTADRGFALRRVWRGVVKEVRDVPVQN